jgi:hypothetical protein
VEQVRDKLFYIPSTAQLKQAAERVPLTICPGVLNEHASIFKVVVEVYEVEIAEVRLLSVNCESQKTNLSVQDFGDYHATYTQKRTNNRLVSLVLLLALT